jgi:N-acetylglucosamine-6-sulfatase
MRKVLATLVLVLATTLVMGWASEAEIAQAAQEGAEKPNIVLILVDDMRADDLEYMPKTRDLIVDRGVEYSNAFATTPQCCPSRASILRGQYAHNHGILRNRSPEGGFEKFESLGHESSTIATWLHDAGYHTALIGKYLNGYPTGDRETYVPPGWDEWYARLEGGGYYDYKLNENGTVVSYGSTERDYSTDVLSDKARGIVRRSADDPRPLFLYLAPSAPHDPHINAPRHDGMFEDVHAQRSPSFDEPDVSDKPEWVRDLPKLSAKEEKKVDQAFRGRLRMLQAVDDMVEGVVDELKATGRIKNTYLFFASDNGFHLGEHRIAFEKNAPYEESVRIPLAVRGPGIPAGRVADQMVLNTDLAPTFADLGGATVPSFVDGRSLRPTLASDAPSWRTAFLEESWKSNPVPKYGAVRTATHKYIKVKDSDDRELYDLTEDPYELDNLYDAADPALLENMKSRLEALKTCAAESCQAAEDGP